MTVHQDSMFYIPGADPGITQWKVETLQLVNWGGFSGHASVSFSPTSTLLSGASGTGKSTLLDAYIAVMMDSSVPFNGASNDATVGRARSADQRSLLSYLRGKQDIGRDSATGELADQVLRGQNSATWGAIALTFIDDRQRRYTVARLYYVPRSAVRDSDLVRKMCTIDGAIDLRALERFAADKFDRRSVTAALPNLTMHDSYSAFSQAFFTRLGIGVGGDGARALRLLARIQAGHQVTSVNDLYTAMVLELPGTYAAADAALEHFGDLEDAHTAMATEEAKARALEPIPELNDTREAELAQARLIDGFGIHLMSGDSPFGLWKLTYEEQLLETAETTNRIQHGEARTDKAVAQNRRIELTGRKTHLEADLGGNEANATIIGLERAVEQLGQDRAAAQSRRETFDANTRRLHLELSEESDFADAQTAARAFLEGCDDAAKVARDERDAIRDEAREPLGLKGELLEEQRSLSGRAGRMDPKLHAIRMQIAEEADIEAELLPFVGELIDIKADHRGWRKAIETTLFGLARVMLVDANQLDHVSKIIDPLRLRGRISFEGVDLTATARPRTRQPDRISGKLEYKDSPFTAWVQNRLTADNTDALCVESPEGLRGPGLRVTASGQTRSGTSGAHGERGAPDVIGFTNTERLAEIAEDLEKIEKILTRHDQKLADADRKIDALAEDRMAHRHVLAVARFRDIDPDGIDNDIRSKQQLREDILKADDTLRKLRTDLEGVEQELGEADKAYYRADTRMAELDDAWSELVERKDAVSGAIDRINARQAVTLTNEQKSYLNTEFAEVATADDLNGFTIGVKRLEKRLATSAEEARAKAQRATQSLETIFRHYQQTWNDPNLSDSVDDYPSYRKILDGILTTGLHKRREEWTRRLTDWSGQDLVPLAGAFGNAIDEIIDRLTPINNILAGLPFGARRDRLKIELRVLNRDDITTFKRELNALARLNVDGMTDRHVQAAFARLQEFMKQIRPEGRGKNTRDYFLDVRKHINVTAVAYDAEGRERATFDRIGGKSGGEAQELVAFIVGAALRFQLGDDENVRPRYAPVFLDEGFVKADSEFTGRSVDAWKGLGFQLIIGAPFDKFTSLEPHADRVLLMVKSPKGYSSVNAIEPVPQIPARQNSDDEGPA
ncbi:hypothetical protein HTZ77_09120 [Nonomuraea sp. SMC257]|uniref:AAA family ATPase n=1 Tax=Nonomuraea montanisoli TaxID=2741721 RepID=A0A7Y6I6E0_9ACTN|nr:SbcC/MukB-like Walker B domain-containing protein [Nonomuraea montanisoli]NUW31585.1 hypothetical protein [Nonomuraea montanisoli]